MKNLELKNLGVQEMNTAEMSTIEGGGVIGDLFKELTGIATNLVKNTLSFIGTQLGIIFGSL
jgi:hypothetical protein